MCPCFFDPYSSNRTTGSLIFDRPCHQRHSRRGDDSRRGRGNGDRQENLKNELATFRRRRNSCCARGTVRTQWPFFQALFYSKAERRLQKRLERLLFDLGFEAVSLSRPEFTSDNFADALRVAKLAGFIILYSGNPLTGENKTSRRAGIRQTAFLDIASGPETQSQTRTKLLGKSARFAESLKFVDEPRKTQQKVN